MRSLSGLAIAAFILVAPVSGRTQAPPAPPAPSAPPASDAAPAPEATQKKIERIHIEDAGTRIDELRYGGETQSITVKPKSGAPEYEVVPFDGARQRPQNEGDNSAGASGQRVWKLFGF
ncbi:MAG: hypothetical protein ABI589_10010 [Burkholderiales bacterium]